MLKNGTRSIEDENFDPKPVVKLFTPDGLDPDHEDRAFGLCDLGMGSPELGYVLISELASVRGPLGLAIERDKWFTADYPLSVYAQAARVHQGVTEDAKALAQAKAVLDDRKRRSA